MTHRALFYIKHGPYTVKPMANQHRFRYTTRHVG